MNRSRRNRWIRAAVALTAAFVMFFPILWMALTSLKTERAAISFPPQFLFSPTFENWRQAVFAGPVLEFMGNTVIITVGATLLALLLGVPAAYAMAFYRTRRTDASMLWMMSTRMLPPAGVIVPLFVLFRNLSLLDTHLGLILLFAAINLPLVVWMTVGFMEDVPIGLLEAARLDGAGLWQEFRSVLLPLLAPGLAATALLAFIFTWNEFFLAVNLTTRTASPLSVYVSTFKAAQGDLFIAKMSAVATAAAIPVLLAGWFAQRQLVSGLTMGAVK